jgi:hypothetical protein
MCQGHPNRLLVLVVVLVLDWWGPPGARVETPGPAGLPGSTRVSRVPVGVSPTGNSFPVGRWKFPIQFGFPRK